MRVVVLVVVVVVVLVVVVAAATAAVVVIVLHLASGSEGLGFESSEKAFYNAFPHPAHL